MNEIDYLVFGSNGFLGSHILKEIRASSHSTLGVSRGRFKENKSENEVVSSYSPEDLTLLLLRTKPKNILISLGLSSISQAEQNPNSSNEVQITMQNIMKAIEKSSPKSTVFLFSSAAVYGDSSNQAIIESNELSPTSFYGHQKVIVERMIQKFALDRNIDLCIIRIFSVYGPKQKRHVVWDVFNKSKKQREVVLAGTGNEIRDFIFVDELAKQIFQLTRLNSNLPDVINLGTGAPISIYDLSKKIISICDLPVRISFSQVIDIKKPFFLYPDVTLARKLGIVNSNAHSLEIGLMLTTNEWKKDEDSTNC
jgi:UDP-glucose 4-epimerase